MNATPAPVSALPLRAPRPPRTALRAALLAASCALAGPAAAQSVTVIGAPVLTSQPSLTPAVAQHLHAVAQENVVAPKGARVELEFGELDSRLKLAPCERVEPFVPSGTRLWGRTRIGLRCMAGPVAWKVFMPLHVRVFGQALVAANALQAGAELTVLDLRYAEVDLTASTGATFTDTEKLAGRVVARSLAPGEVLRSDSLRARQWFGAGDTVTLMAMGRGFSISGEGQALNPGLEGQPVRVRTESGRIVTGVPVGLRRVEVRL